MASTPSTQPEQHPLLRRPLYVYDLREPLLSTLTPRDADSTAPAPSPEPTADPAATPRDTTSEVSTATSCALCDYTGATVADQRAHAKSDFHQFNVKRRTRNEPAVREREWEALLDQDLAESISGSDTDSDASSGRETDDVTTLLRRKAVITAAEEDDGDKGQRTGGGAGKAPLVWFASSELPAEISLGVYRGLFSKAEQATGDYLSALRQKQGTTGHVFLCMIGGGHFAAAVVALARRPGGDAHVLASKTFHRYTTRRKQGGAQAASDAAKGAAHSAGSSLRRQNEAALTAEVRALLASWAGHIDTADLLFVRATGNSNRRTLFGYDGAVLRANDPRVRSFPFTTRRATNSELLRAFNELTRAKVSALLPEALPAAAAPKAPKPVRAASPPPPVLSPEDEAAALHTTQLTALIRRSKIPALLSYLSSNNLPATFSFFPPAAHHHAPTPLHLAASLNSPALVTALLTKPSPPADPAAANADAKTPFDLAGDRATRDAFRLARASLGEAAADWTAAHVPAPLTRAEVVAREAEAKKAADDEEKARREKELARLAEERAKSRKVMGGRPGTTLGGMERVLTGVDAEGQVRGLTAEGRVKLERERRARAAEERMKRFAGGK
ncbi:hypothetical protein EDC01DRAFT_96458 [Geopyxis carbonaria]|nr:hypothetical protein EDC01DRAFT_96458 [Geopyxis carbonaria]